MYRIFGIDRLSLNDMADGLVIIVILKHHHMYLKYLRVCFADLSEGFFIDKRKFFLRFDFCGFHTGKFRFYINDTGASNLGFFFFKKNRRLAHSNCPVYTFSCKFQHIAVSSLSLKGLRQKSPVIRWLPLPHLRR